MNEKTRAALLELNRRFYAQFAGDFSRTRRSWPPSFDRILPYLRACANVADLGCGNGRLLTFLAEKGWRGRYLGADGSPELLAVARAQAGHFAGITSRWMQIDLTEMAVPALEPTSMASLHPSIAAVELLGRASWDAITLLAVLHHIPGAVARARLVAACAELLRPGATLIVSTWQFLAAPRLAGRILPWSEVKIDPGEVEPGDYLLPWGETASERPNGAAGRRYCSAIDEATLRRLTEDAGLAQVEAFYSDGKEGNLNLYGVFRKRLA